MYSRLRSARAAATVRREWKVYTILDAIVDGSEEHQLHIFGVWKCVFDQQSAVRRRDD